MSDIAQLTTAIREFARERDRERFHTPFHTPKNLAMALSVEVAELVELFQWLTPKESAALIETTEGRTATEDEIADITIYLPPAARGRAPNGHQRSRCRKGRPKPRPLSRPR